MIRLIAVFAENVEQFRAHAKERAAYNDNAVLDLTRNELLSGDFKFFYVDRPDQLQGCHLYNYEFWGNTPNNFSELMREAHQRMRGVSV